MAQPLTWDAAKAQWSFDVATDPLTWNASGFSATAPKDYVKKTYGYDISKSASDLSSAAVAAKYGYDPKDLSDAGYEKMKQAWSKAYADFEVAAAPQWHWQTSPISVQQARDEAAAIAATRRNLVWQDYAAATKQYFNAKTAGTLAEIEAGKLRRKQFDQMRKIATEGNEEASEDQKPTGKASVLIGSNIPERRQKRTSTSRDAGTARAKVKVQAKGINI